MFLGLMTKDHLVQIMAVAIRERDWVPLTDSIGLLMSLIPAKTKPHFKVGAQKWMVLGPVSLFRKAWNLDPEAEAVELYDLLKEWAEFLKNDLNILCIIYFFLYYLIGVFVYLLL